jgi:hypothetical protein
VIARGEREREREREDEGQIASRRDWQVSLFATQSLEVLAPRPPRRRRRQMLARSNTRTYTAELLIFLPLMVTTCRHLISDNEECTAENDRSLFRRSERRNERTRAAATARRQVGPRFRFVGKRACRNYGRVIVLLQVGAWMSTTTTSQHHH